MGFPALQNLPKVGPVAAVAAAVTVVFRKTLSTVGTKTGSRQIHNTE